MVLGAAAAVAVDFRCSRTRTTFSKSRKNIKNPLRGCLTWTVDKVKSSARQFVNPFGDAGTRDGARTLFDKFMIVVNAKNHSCFLFN